MFPKTAPLRLRETTTQRRVGGPCAAVSMVLSWVGQDETEGLLDLR
jgi:hypothetical protein